MLLLVFFVMTLSIGFASEDTKITVLNPRGIQPPIRLIPLAPRLDTLDLKQARLNGARATSQFFEHAEFSSVS